MTDDVLVEQRDRILLITINRPAARNAIDAAVTKGVAAALDDLDGRNELSIGILTGRRDVLRRHGPQGVPAGRERRAARRADRSTAEKALIAAVEGYALAGGCELVLACDLVVAAENAKFGIPEVKRAWWRRGAG